MDIEEKFLLKIERHQGIIRKVCMMYEQSKEDREDLFQETLYNAWKSYPKFRGDSGFSTWLYKVALNTAMYNKRKGRRQPKTLSLDFAEDSSFESKSEDQFQQLYMAIQYLNEVEKSIVLLVLEDLSYRQIGEIIGFTENNIGVRVSRIKQKLNKLMSRHGF
jgi:RNA polymerase sigma factor (sigma-70 family)